MSKILTAAMKIFASRPCAYSVSKNLLSGTKIEVFRDGVNGLKKVVTKADGRVVTSDLTKDGKFVTGIKDVTNRGEIAYSFEAQNYDKVIDVRPKNVVKYSARIQILESAN